MKLIFLFCFSLFISTSFGQSRSNAQRQVPLFLQEKGGSFVKVNSSGKLYVSGGEDFSFHLVKNPNNSKEAIIVDDKYNLELNLASNDEPVFTASGSYFELSKASGKAGFLITRNGAYLAHSEGEFRWESHFNLANALVLRPKSRAARSDRSGGRDISGRSSGRSSATGRSSSGSRSSTSSSSAGSSSNKSSATAATPKPSTPPPAKTGGATIKFDCNRCKCSSYMAILIEGKNLPERYLGLFDKKCQIVVSDLNPGYYKLIVKTLSSGGGDRAETGWDTIKIDRSSFSVEAGRTETITVRQTGG